MKGKLPQTAEMILESNEDQWYLLVNGLINTLKTSAIIQISSERKARIQLVIHTAIPPESLDTYVENIVETSLEKSISSGINRISDFIANKLEKNKWIFVGEIIGENNIPIVIVYYQTINLFVYSQKLAKEKNKKFFPGLN
ncbi:MAG: hypothetical protein PHG95_01505 [Patescibacteria group bacterium]|nr:hypothetical protein [Patescibacteria group bacterium]